MSGYTSSKINNINENKENEKNTVLNPKYRKEKRTEKKDHKSTLRVYQKLSLSLAAAVTKFGPIRAATFGFGH